MQYKCVIIPFDNPRHSPLQPLPENHYATTTRESEYVDSKYHVRLLAMTRLGTLPVEIETGRWENKPRAERLCRLGCNEVGDVAHFMVRCAALSTERVPSLARSAVTTGASSPLCYWRAQHREKARVSMERKDPRPANSGGRTASST